MDWAVKRCRPPRSRSRRRPSGARLALRSCSPSFKTLPLSGLRFLGTPGVRSLLTAGVFAVGDAFADVCAQGRFVCVLGFGCVLGEAGVGETFAVRTAARRPGELVLLDYRAHPV
ncbi:hypothetical protein [Streptomyces camelliae]|uniref:Uncharacterized protein n=1 Tax=Streptomyces camelliae TaxID=3004093 RepID=A0ABY7PGZ3_9ACTN|nr:hypothetical protein [Streptomyces sp. HUAS 2-6]WBO68854.1 hypothetical protein O1G22_41730 [Streptomyces sp. HUAS 2-6]